MSEQANPSISITDLENILKVIDAASERGAFKGAELSTVGGIRDKVAGFLEHVAKQRAEAASAPVEATEAPKE